MNQTHLRLGLVAGITPAAAKELLHLLHQEASAANVRLETECFWEPAPEAADPLVAKRDEAMLVLDATCLFTKHHMDAVLVVSPRAEEYVADVQAEVAMPLVAVAPTTVEMTAAARNLLSNPPTPHALGFKVGMIGGLGPAATVDLFDKIVKATHAKTDQEHFKLVIEENPQIPDRTACLLAGGKDPTVSMYHAARRLEASGCEAIIVPCNTAHAFLPTLKRRLRTPFIDMQMTTLENIQARFKNPRIGLLATSGTIATGIYGEKAKAMGLTLVTPDEEHQKLVMSAIYGPKGAKAGFCDGVCKDELLAAAEHLVKEHDCNVLILGCTELPLILDECDNYPLAGKSVAFVDPTAILARKVVEIAEATNAKRHVR